MDPSGTTKMVELLIKSMGISGLVGVPSFVLFGPDSMVTTLGFLSARSDYRIYFGGALLLGVSMLVREGGSGVLAKLSEWRRSKLRKREQSKFGFLWNKLDNAERAILRGMFENHGSLEHHIVIHFERDVLDKTLLELKKLGLVEQAQTLTRGGATVLTKFSRQGLRCVRSKSAEIEIQGRLRRK